MKFVYKPFQLLARSLGTKLGKTAFQSVWTKVGDGEHPPSPTAGRVSVPKVAAAAALEAATMAAIGAAIDQLTARSFHHLIGAWPEKPPEPES
jgi:hypothetical protein